MGLVIFGTIRDQRHTRGIQIGQDIQEKRIEFDREY